MSEADFMRRCMKVATDVGARLFRNNVGQAWVGNAQQFKKRTTYTTFTFESGDVLIRQGRLFRAGLPGMSDLIGFVPVTITHEHVGKKLAVYAAAETKTATGRATAEQAQFIAMVLNFGGLAGIVRTDQDLMEVLQPSDLFADGAAKKAVARAVKNI